MASAATKLPDDVAQTLASIRTESGASLLALVAWKGLGLGIPGLRMRIVAASDCTVLEKYLFHLGAADVVS